jgi:hypothetical protein
MAVSGTLLTAGLFQCTRRKNVGAPKHRLEMQTWNEDQLTPYLETTSEERLFPLWRFERHVGNAVVVRYLDLG